MFYEKYPNKCICWSGVLSLVLKPNAYAEHFCYIFLLFALKKKVNLTMTELPSAPSLVQKQPKVLDPKWICVCVCVLHVYFSAGFT